MNINPTVERGCLLTNDFEVIPFDNVSKTPEHLIEVSEETWCKFADLMIAEELYAWVHSHPYSLAAPSNTDITFHQFPCNMIIYSTRYKHFTEWTPEDLEDLEAGKELTLIEYMEKIVYGKSSIGDLGAYLCGDDSLSGVQPRGHLSGDGRRDRKSNHHGLEF
jgi:proteasome lid subunit RPN8/RPN11